MEINRDDVYQSVNSRAGESRRGRDLRLAPAVCNMFATSLALMGARDWRDWSAFVLVPKPWREAAAVPCPSCPGAHTGSWGCESQCPSRTEAWIATGVGGREHATGALHDGCYPPGAVSSHCQRPVEAERVVDGSHLAVRHAEIMMRSSMRPSLTSPVAVDWMMKTSSSRTDSPTVKEVSWLE